MSDDSEDKEAIDTERSVAEDLEQVASASADEQTIQNKMWRFG